MKHKVEKANFKLIEVELYNYHETRLLIENEKEDIIDASPSVEASSKSRPGKPTESKAVKMLSSKALIEAERRINAIANVLNQLEAMGEQDKLKLIKLKYFDIEKKYTDMGVWSELNIGQATYYRWRKEIVELIALKLGWRV